MVKFLIETPIFQTDFTKFIFTNLFKVDLKFYDVYENKDFKFVRLKSLLLEFIEEFFQKNYTDHEKKLKSEEKKENHPLTIIKNENDKKKSNLNKDQKNTQKLKTHQNYITSKENLNSMNIPENDRFDKVKKELLHIKPEFLEHLKFLENQYLFYKNRFEVFSLKMDNLIQLKNSFDEKDLSENNIKKEELELNDSLKKRNYDEFEK